MPKSYIWYKSIYVYKNTKVDANLTQVEGCEQSAVALREMLRIKAKCVFSLSVIETNP